MKILLFIPVYNCEKQIIRLLKKIQIMKTFDFYEILIINNQSKDNTLNEIINYKYSSNFLKLKIISNSLNIGLGGTHKMAFQYSMDHNFDGCLILHGDDQGNIIDMPFDSLAYNSYLFGSRFSFKSRLINYSKFRIFGNLLLNTLASVLSLKLISDFGGSGLNYFPTDKIKDHDFWNYPDDLTFHAYLLLNNIKLNQHIIFFPITWSELDQTSNVRLFSQTIKYFKILTNYLVTKNLIDKTCKANNKTHATWLIHEKSNQKVI